MPSAWPTSFPQRFLVSGYSQSAPDGLIRSDNDVGPANVRRRSSAAAAPLAGSVVMTSQQLSDFQSFVAYSLFDASLPFAFPDPLGSGKYLLVRFVGQPAWQPYGLQWEVALKLEVLPGGYVTGSPTSIMDFSDSDNSALVAVIGL